MIYTEKVKKQICGQYLKVNYCRKRKKNLTPEQLLVFFIDVRCQFSDPDSAQTYDQR